TYSAPPAGPPRATCRARDSPRSGTRGARAARDRARRPCDRVEEGRGREVEGRPTVAASGASSGVAQGEADRGREAIPLRDLGLELRPPGFGERIELRLATR